MMRFETGRVQLGSMLFSSELPSGQLPVAPATCCLMFPRRSAWIEPDDGPPFVADATTVLAYAWNRPFPHGTTQSCMRADWFAVSTSPHQADSFPFERNSSSAATYFAQRRIIRYVRTTPAPDPGLVERAIIDLTTRVLHDVSSRRAAQHRPSDVNFPIVERTRALLGSSYTVNVSLAEIARYVDCSPFHLCRVFKRHTGYTIHQYRTQLRLRHSLDLLEREPSDILNTAIQLGFSGHSQYTKAFHLAFGITPSVFSRTPPRTPYATVFSQGQLSL